MRHTSWERCIFVTLIVLTYQMVFTDARRRDSKIIGINYGLLGDNLPPPKEAIKLVMEKGIQGVRIDEPNHEVLEALRGTGLIISVGVKNVDLAEIAGSKEAANKWIQTNYVPYYEDVFIEYISVGNEAIPGPNAEYVFPAMQNLDASFRAAGLYESVHISTTVSTKVLSNSHTPSKAIFAYDSAYYMNEIAKFLDSNSFPLMINVYPFFAMYADPSYNTLNYAIFGSETPVFYDQGLPYYNLYEATVDAFVAAMWEPTEGRPIDIVVAETGWPSAGNSSFASVGLARVYNNNLLKFLEKGTTPRYTRYPIETYLYALFNENLKPEGVEQNFGNFYPSMEPVYPLCDTVGLDMKWEARNVPTSPGRLHRLCEYICAKLLTIYSRVFFLLFLIISNFMQVSFAH